MIQGLKSIGLEDKPISFEDLFENNKLFKKFNNWGSFENEYKLDSSMHSNIIKSYHRLLNNLKSDVIAYGTSTHFGDNFNDKNELPPQEHQQKLLEYLCVATGPLLDSTVVRRALRIQAFKNAKGLSGIHPETFEKLILLSNSKNLPKVPRYGSLGASGDLVTMAQAVRPIFNEGVKGERDVLALVNTNSMMASYACELLSFSKKAFYNFLECSVMLSEALGYDHKVFRSHYYEKANAPKDVIDVCKYIESHFYLNISRPRVLQARYSFRCMPMIAGEILSRLNRAQSKIIEQIEMVSDNPMTLEGEFFHGGLFYAIGITEAADSMSKSLYQIVETLDRQILVAMDSKLSGLATNLSIKGKSHVKGLHQLMSSLLQSLRSKQLPGHMMSFSCEGNNQDVVPCGMSALIQLDEATKIVKEALKISRFISSRASFISKEMYEEVSPLDSWREYELVDP